MKLANLWNLTTLSALALASGVAGAQAQAPASAHVLWSIGQEDHNDSEFALAPGSWQQYQDDGYYIVGQSRPERDWPYVQPGPRDAWAGGRPHTANINFQLTQAVPEGTCRLTLSLIDAQNYLPPQIQIRVNGQTWVRNTVAGGGDDSIDGKPSSGKPSAITVDFPANVLKTGGNTIQITTLQGSWMIYDAVTLTAPDGDTLGTATNILILNDAAWLPNVLKRENGKLQQVMHLHLFNSGAPQNVVLKVAGESDRPITIPAGHNMLEVSYPESQTASRSTIQLFAQGQPIADAVTSERTPCRQYAIYCLPQSHMDIGYDYLPQKALALHQQYLETGLKLNADAKAQGLPTDDRFRWNAESLYEVDDWLKRATPAQISEFQKAVRSGDLGLSALYCNELTGLCRPEELAALLACANNLRGKYNIPIDSAMISDVPGYTWALASVLAQSGVKYISWGPNGGDHTGRAHGFDNQAFYWQGPSGKDKVLVWQSPNGYYPDFSPSDEALIGFIGNYDRQYPGAPYEFICNRYTKGDNGPADPDLAPFVHSWNSRYAYPHLILSTTSRMLHDFAARYGSTLKTVRGDYTGYWEDGAASTARETAINRNAAEAIAQNQILYSMLAPATYPGARFEDAWKNAVLYDEHTWGADRSWTEPESDFTTQQWEFKKQFALRARDQAQSLRRDALRGVTAPASSNTIAVFNTCSWKRTDLVILPAAISRAGDIVRNSQGADVPSQRLKDGSLAFLASDIPATASRKFQIVAGKSKYHGAAAANTAGAIHTGKVSLTIDPATGAITSWKTAGRELVDSQNKTSRGLNDYLYILGPSNDKIQYASDAKVTVLDNGPLVASLRVDSSAPGSKSLSRVIQVVDGLDQVRLEDTMDKIAVHEDEAVQIGFNFRVPSARVRMDMPWSVITPDQDQTPNANKNVYPVGRWADLSNGEFGVTCAPLNSPMMEIGEITSPREGEGAWLTKAKTGSAIYWNVMNNYWHTNYKAYQPGVAAFRYVLRAHGKYDQTAAQQFGVGQNQPLLFAPVKPNQPEIAFPLTLSSPAVQLTSCRPAPGGAGWIVRLYNGSDHTQPLTLSWKGAKNLLLAKTDLWGNAGTPVKNALTLAPMEIVTLRVTP